MGPMVRGGDLALASDTTREDSNQAGAWYGLTVLLIAYTVSFIDRTILSLLVGPIKADLGISDTQLSLLHGLAFAIFYTILGIPIARLADRYSRRWIISVGVFVWSLMTAACGLARSFWMLFFARVGGGVGEAALSPAAYSMIADYFAPSRLGRALGIYSAGVYVGAGLAFIIGGAVIQAIAAAPSLTLPIVGTVQMWQATFFIVGLPGVLVAGLTLSMREPARRTGAKASSRAAAPKHATVAELIAFLRAQRYTFGCHFLGYSLLALTFNGVIAWAPAYLVRVFDMSRGDIGAALGLSILVFGAVGIIAGGWVADMLSRRGHEDGTIITGVISAAGVSVSLPLAFTAPSAAQAIFWVAPFMFFSSFAYGAAAAALQFVTPNHMRAQVSAIYLFVLNFLGIGLGPTAVAMVTDYVLEDESAVGVSIAVVGTGAAVIGGVVLYVGRRFYRRSLRERRAAT